MVPLDVINDSENLKIDMQVMWFITYMVTLVMIVILIPYAIFFYETDPEKTFCRRFFTALMFLIATLLVVSAILFVSWYFLRYVDLPIVEITT
jgi:LMBR1 domain-containing protein 1